MAVSLYTGDDRYERGASVEVKLDADDAWYDATLAGVPDQQAARPGLLDQVWMALTRFHARRRPDGESLPPEYWFWSP
jgi:hypothetical protein